MAVAIGWDDLRTVQYEGTASELHGDELEECKSLHLTKNPGSAISADLVTERYFKIAPEWIRYTDVSTYPEYSFELSFAKSDEIE